MVLPGVAGCEWKTGLGPGDVLDLNLLSWVVQSKLLLLVSWTASRGSPEPSSPVGVGAALPRVGSPYIPGKRDSLGFQGYRL